MFRDLFLVKNLIAEVIQVSRAQLDDDIKEIDEEDKAVVEVVPTVERLPSDIN